MPTPIFLLSALSAAAAVAVSTWALCRFHFYERQVARSKAEGRQALNVLSRLQQLATRVATDVGEHSNQVEEINDSLLSATDPHPNLIVDTVVRLVETNQQMQEKLSSTEDKLREQAQQIEVHAAEARTDALTLLANRRAFSDELARRVDEFRRHGRVFSVVMVDVDHFKMFNDTYGHETGDEVLRGVARVLRRKMREMDLVARYGGEEFSIILPGTPLGDACRAALRAQEAIEKFRFPQEGEDLQVTASFGVAEARQGEECAALLKRMDTALYASKQAGRNCIHWHDAETVHRVLSDEAPRTPWSTAKAARGPLPAKLETGRTAAPGPAASPGAPEHIPGVSKELDPSSALPNRSIFCQHVRNRLAEWNRGGSTFSVLLVEVHEDADGTERDGQPAHDVSRQAAATLVSAAIREMDLVSLYAPDCFAALLPSAALADAIRVAERLGEACLQYSASVEYDQPRLVLCVGVVQVTSDDDFLSLLKRAESALDAANRHGGNRIYCHDGERCVPISTLPEVMDSLV